MRRSVTVGAIALVLVAGLAAPPAAADLQGDLDDVGRRIDEFRSQLGGVEAERSDVAEALLATDARLDEVRVRYEAALDELADVDSQVTATEAVIAELQASIDRRSAFVTGLREKVEGVKSDALERAVELYMAPWPEDEAGTESIVDARSVVALVYADRVQEVADRDISRLEALREDERRIAARQESEQEELGRQLADLEDVRALRELAAARVADQREQVEEQLAAQQALLAEVDARIGEIEGEIAGLAAEEDRIRVLIAQEQVQAGTRPGILVRPVVPGGVSSGYGYRIHPIYGTERLHTGLDMNASCGQPVMAAEAGRVFLADWKGGYGIAVMIDHGGGMSTLYGHLSSTAVGYGQQVGAGQVIGYGGTTGVSTSCHLHFEVRINGSPVDPAPYL